MTQIPDLIADKNVALLLDGLKYLATLLVGGWVGYRWKLLENRYERRRVFRVAVLRLAAKVAAGNPFQAAELHDGLCAVLRDACIDVMGDLGRWQRKKIDAAWKEFAAMPREALAAGNGGSTEAGKLQDMRRGLDAMEAKLLAMEKMI